MTIEYHAGGFVIAEANNRRIRHVAPDGIMTTVAGTGHNVHSGDGGPATEASLPDDRQVYVASAGLDSESVVTLSRSSDNGALTQPPRADGCTNRLGLLGCRRGRGLLNAAAVSFSPDRASVYVPARDGNVAIFTRQVPDGALAQASNPLGCVSGNLPSRFCIASKGGHSTLEGRHIDIAAVRAHDRVVGASERTDTYPANGLLTQLAGSGCVSIPTSDRCTRARGIVPSIGEGTEDVVISPDARTVYAASTTDEHGGGIAVLRRDATSGALRELRGGAGCLGDQTSCTPLRGVNGIDKLALSPDGRHAYALSSDDFDAAVAIFRVGN